MAVCKVLDQHPTPYSRIAKKAGGLCSPSVILNPTNVKSILDTLTQLGIAKHEQRQRTDNQLPTQLYSAKDPEGLPNALNKVFNNPFLKALGYSDPKNETGELVGLP